MNCRYDGTNDGRQSYIKMMINNFTAKRQCASENGKQFHAAMYEEVIAALKKEVAAPEMCIRDRSATQPQPTGGINPITGQPY